MGSTLSAPENSASQSIDGAFTEFEVNYKNEATKKHLIGQVKEYFGEVITEYLVESLEKSAGEHKNKHHVGMAVQKFYQQVNRDPKGFLIFAKNAFVFKFGENFEKKDQIKFLFESVFRLFSRFYPNNFDDDFESIYKDRYFVALVQYFEGFDDVIAQMFLLLPRVCELSKKCFCKFFKKSTILGVEFPRVDSNRLQVGCSNFMMKFFSCYCPFSYIAQSNNVENVWSCLFDLSLHGTSMSYFEKHCSYYNAPLIVICKWSDESEFVIGIDSMWERNRVRGGNFGGEQCFLLQTHPEFMMITEGSGIIAIKGGVGKNKNNDKNNGILVGKMAESPIFKIEDNFVDSTLAYKTFRTGKISSILVFGCNSTVCKNDPYYVNGGRVIVKAEDDPRPRNATKNLHESGLKNADKALLEFAGIEVDRNREQL